MKLENHATSIEKVIDLITDHELELNSIYIKSNFGSIPNSISKLESSKICLVDAILVIEEEKKNSSSTKYS
jgi:hypothetical protein